MKPFLTLALLVCPAAAQTSPCLALNDVRSNLPTGTTSTPAAKALAFSITPSATITAQGARIYTANAAGKEMGLELLAGGTLPGRVLGSGVWRSTTTPGWQGCNFDRAITLSAGTQYWLVWRDPGSSTMPTATTGRPMDTRGGIGAFWVVLPQHIAMLRLYCSLLDGRNARPFGTACSASSGTRGTVFSNTNPSIGNQAFSVQASGFAANSTAVVFIGDVPNWPGTNISFPGADPSCRMYTSAALLTLFTSTSSGGGLHLPAAIPNDPNLKGLYFDFQVAAADPGSPYSLPFVTSNRLGVTLF